VRFLAAPPLFIPGTTIMPPFITQILSNYGHYARLMVALAVVAYSDPMSSIPEQVEQQLGVQVVWGPAEIGDGLGVSYTRAFITRDSTGEEYTVVIRGTNALSALSWTLEDFEVGTAVPFDSVVRSAPDGAMIARGTYLGIAYLAELRDPVTHQTIVEYLVQQKPPKVLVTGHSLGGTLVPPMFAYLNDALNGGGYAQNMAPFSFAGLTPGNAAFNTYFNGLFDPALRWRFHNTLDIAPYLWASPDSLQHVYTPYNLSWGWPESDWLARKFREAAPIGYAQPAGDVPLPGVFDSTFVDDRLWAAQAVQQHHGCTYHALVNTAFPDSAGSAAGSPPIRRPICPLKPAAY
jgi:hypothetical protein